MKTVDRTTLNIDREALAKAAALTGVKEKTALVRMGLEALIAKASAERLAALAGSEKRLRPIPRRRESRCRQALTPLTSSTAESSRRQILPLINDVSGQAVLERISNGEIDVAVILHRPEHAGPLAPEKIGAGLGPEIVAEGVAQRGDDVAVLLAQA